MQITAITRGAGLTEAPLSRGYAATAKNANATKALARTNNAYYEISLTPKLAHEVNLTALQFRFRSLATGPRNYRWMYSKDNGATFVELGAADESFLLSDGEGEVSPLIDFSANADLHNLHNSNTIIFRLYLWGNTSTSTVFGFGRDVATSTDPTFRIYGSVIREILPVELALFTANRQQSSVKLSWQTSSEKNNSHFDVIRFEEGKTKEVIGKILAKGDGTSVQQYGFTDFNPPSSTTYYQLNQIDLDGKFQFYPPVYVRAITTVTTLKVNVNVTGNIKVLVQSDAEKLGHISVIDLTGKRVVSRPIKLQKGSNVFELNEQLSKGIYVADIQLVNGERMSAKFIY